MENKKFNIRVYGILINENNHVLIADELIKGHKISKFPGGGLEFGEGTIDCIKREFLEETNNKIEVVEHFYTTDFFQASAFHPNHQVISIYYIVKPVGEFIIKKSEEIVEFKWIDLKTISADDFTLPIDKVVITMLKRYDYHKIL